MHNTRYLCDSWQGLLRHITSLISKGYYWYLPIIPKRQLDERKWERTDNNLLNKFQVRGKTKHKHYYGKKRRIANYVYFRYNSIAFVMRTEGKLIEGTESEIFHDIRRKYIEIQVSADITLKICKPRDQEQFTVYLARNSYRAIKAEFLKLLYHRKLNELKFRFNNLNNIPSYSGIFNQKVNLKNQLFSHAKKNGIYLSDDDFPISDFCNTYDVFKSILVR